ncbi:MAG: MbnH family di-heme enzyme [Hyphomicrobiaceae bacterium]
MRSQTATGRNMANCRPRLALLRRPAWAWLHGIVLAVTVLSGHAPAATAKDFTWRLPVGMAPPPVPASNPMSSAKIELGRRLFFDIRLSGPGYMACATCHKPELAFTDGRKVAIGVTGQRHTRNSPTLTNVAYLSRFGWAQPKHEVLEVQLRRPMFGENPIEMGTLGHEVPVLTHIRSNSVYRQLFETAFAGEATASGDAISFDNIGRAIAAFQRTIVSANAPYDKFVGGDQTALSAAARRGLRLFSSARLNCSKCHVPPFFTDAIGDVRFHNTGLYNVDGTGRLPGTDQGLTNETKMPADIGRFRTPTLRNIKITAPYMHDGSVASLKEVIDHYAAGGRAALHGAPSPLRSPLVRGFRISASERQDVIAFLDSLTDTTFLAEPSFRSPYQ